MTRDALVLLLVVVLTTAPTLGRAADTVTYGSTTVMDDDHPPAPPGQQRISFKPPELDEEESESMALPGAYRCDACAAVAYQIEAQFKKAEANKSAKRKRRLSEMEVIDILESKVCVKANMDQYGIKGLTDAEPGQEKLLNGPGLPRTMSKMGVIQGGGQWPNRLLRRCGEIVGEVGEDVIYSMYVDSSESSHREVENPEEEYAVMFSRLCHEGVHDDSTGDCGGDGKTGKGKSAKKKKKGEGGKKKKKSKKKAKRTKGEL